jgi:hypothetical protein
MGSDRVFRSRVVTTSVLVQRNANGNEELFRSWRQDQIDTERDRFELLRFLNNLLHGEALLPCAYLTPADHLGDESQRAKGRVEVLVRLT